MVTEEQVYEALEQVKDPEIPVISVVDLGIISEVQVVGNRVSVELTPTFAGCPAIDVMKSGVEDAVKSLGVTEVEVTVNFNKPWTSNSISAKGRQLLKEFGLSPPPAFDGMLTLEVLEGAVCPVCGSNNTYLMSTFGPTACRAIHHCNNCQETFEQFKPL